MVPRAISIPLLAVLATLAFTPAHGAPNSTLDPEAAAPRGVEHPQASPPLPALKPLTDLPATAATTGLQSLSLDGQWDLTGIDPRGGRPIRIPAGCPGWCIRISCARD